MHALFWSLCLYFGFKIQASLNNLPSCILFIQQTNWDRVHEIDRERESEKRGRSMRNQIRSRTCSQTKYTTKIIWYVMVYSVCTTLLALALCTVTIFHLFINFDGYAVGEINWNDIYCSNNRRQQRDHSAISMMTINKWRWQEPNHFHIWPIAKHKISLITWTISYFIYRIYYVLTKHVAKPQAYGQQVKGNAIENQNKTTQW